MMADKHVLNRRALCLGVLGGALAHALPGRAQSPATQPQGRGRGAEPASYRLFSNPPDTHALQRRVVTIDAERSYQIFTAVPRKPHGGSGYRALYMLDGNSVFNRMTAEQLALAQDTVLIGIGYDTPFAIDSVSRSRDYTPPRSDGAVVDAGRSARPIGGAPRFLELMQGELRSRSEEGLEIDPRYRGLWGHSYGGLFTLFALFNAPDAWSCYCPISPSTGWGEGVLGDYEQKAARRSVGQADVFIALGDSERRGSRPPGSGQGEVKPEPLPAPMPSATTMALIERLKQRRDLAVQSEVFAGLGHGQTFAASFPRAFQVVAEHR